MSYVSHSQVWGLLDGGTLYVGGRTNRAQITFERELVEILNQIQCEPIANAVEAKPEPIPATLES
jgi:cytochrome c biogenesis protein